MLWSLSPRLGPSPHLSAFLLPCMPSWVSIMVDAFRERSLQVPPFASAAASGRTSQLPLRRLLFLLQVLTEAVLIVTLVTCLVPLL